MCKFGLGKVVMTRGAMDVLEFSSAMLALERHQNCDWGDCCNSDWELNNNALCAGDRLVSVYNDIHGIKFWIITESDRSVTTILLPEEY